MMTNILMDAKVEEKDGDLRVSVVAKSPTEGETALGFIVASYIRGAVDNWLAEKTTAFSEGTKAAEALIRIEQEIFVACMRSLTKGKSAEEQREIIKGFCSTIMEKAQQTDQSMKDIINNQSWTWQ